MKFSVNFSFNDISNYRLLLVRAIILGDLTIITIITDFDIKVICYLYKKFLSIHIILCTEIFE